MKSILALGTESKTAFSILDKEGLFVSEPGGDITDLDSFVKYEGLLRDCMKQRSFLPDRIACDLHPDYRSTVLAEELRRINTGSELVRVQHHFAHIAACMHDNGLDEKVIGVSFDGTGYGTDGRSWGSEFFICDFSGFERRYHLEYVHQPGGDVAARQGWRMAMAYLYNAFGGEVKDVDMPFMKSAGHDRCAFVVDMMEKDVNCPATSSMGRLFDAVSGLLGVCESSSFEGEAAIKLEEETAGGVSEYYDYDISGDEISVRRMTGQILEDMDRSVGRDIISAKFHNTIGEIVLDICSLLSEETGIRKTLISGGCFQNSYLVRYIEKGFKELDIELYKHKKFPTTDLNISIGQAVAASKIAGMRQEARG